MEKHQSSTAKKHRLLDFRLEKREVPVSQLLNGYGPHLKVAQTIVRWQYIDSLFSRLPLPSILLEDETSTILRGQELYNSLHSFYVGELVIPIGEPSALYDFNAGKSFKRSNRADQRRFEEKYIDVYFVGHKPNKEVLDILTRRFPNP